MRYIVKKLGVLIVTLLIISILAFLAFQIIPGDPTTKMLGTQATPERVAALRAELGLDKPVITRYFSWLTGMLTGDLGRSYSYNMAVTEILSGKLSVTLVLSLMSFAMVILISVPLSLLIAKYEGRAFSRIFGVLNQITMSIPPFFIGMLFTFFFGLVLKLFTPGAFVSITEDVGGFLTYLAFPALAIALPKSAMTIKLFRSSIQSEMRKDYIRTAYSRGNSRAMVLKGHVIRNAIIPVVTFLAATLADIIAGSIIIEQVFAIPGVGRLLLSSISNRDFPVAQAIVLFIAAIVIVLNFAADIAYQYIDPRIRLA